MNVAFVTTGLGTGGAETALLRLLPRLRRFDVESMVVSLRCAGTIGPRLVDAGIPVVTLGLPGAVAAVKAWGLTRTSLRAFSPHLLHGWMYHGNLAALAAGWRLQLPVAWGIRQSLAGTRDKWLTRRVIDAGARLSQRADLIVYNSAVARAEHEGRGYDGTRAAVIPNGFDTDLLRGDESTRASVRSELGIAPAARVVAQVARFHAGKDYPTLLRAAARVVVAFPDARFLLIGESVAGSNSELADIVRELELDKHVLMLGRRDDVPRLLCAADVAVLSSAGMEGFPNALGEAMSCGVPCVGTRVGDVPHLIGDTGEVVAPSDPEAIAAGIVRLLSLPAEQRRALGARARQRIIDNFTIDHVAQRYADLLFQVAGISR